MFDYSKTPVDQRGITIIITPLLGLGDSQVQELNNPQMLGGSTGTAIFLNGDSSPKDLKDVVSGRYRVVYLSPEKADADEVKKSMWFSAAFRHLILLIAVDEAHLVDEWYIYRIPLVYIVVNSFRGKEFRKSYGRLGHIRGVFGKRPPWFITSATLPDNQLAKVLESLKIDNPIRIDEPLDRPNLYYNVINSNIGDRFRGGGETPLDHVVEFVPNESGQRWTETNLPKIKKTLVYFDSINTLGAFLHHLRNLLILAGVPRNLAIQLIQSYFATRSPEAKVSVLKSFQAGTALIVLATEAFGMGMDVPDILRVYNWGIPRSLAALIQRFGRGARARGKTAVCTIILPKYCSTLKHRDHPERLDIQLQPTTQQPLIRATREKGLSVALQRLKTRSQDLYEFLTHYCLRRAIMEYLNAGNNDEEYEPLADKPCCVGCSQVRFEANFNQYDNRTMGPRHYQDLCQKEPAIEGVKTKQTTKKPLREAVERALEKWRKDIWAWLLFNQESHHLVPELIITDKILKDIAAVSWKLCQDDIPIDKLVTWAGYRIYIPGNKSVERVIRDAYQEALENEEEENRKTRAERRAERILATTGRIVKIRGPRRTDSQNRSNSPRASSPSRPLSPSLDSDPEDSLYIPVTTEIEASAVVYVEDEDVLRQADY